MPRWFFSLQFRLMVGFALVLALALGAVGLYIGYQAREEVARIQRDFEQVRRERVYRMVAQFYDRQGEWTGLQQVVENAGRLYSRHIVVTDTGGKVVGDTRVELSPPRGRGDDRPPFPVMNRGRRVGFVAVMRSDIPEEVPEPPLTRFAERTNRSLLWAGLAAGAGGILLVSLMSRRVLSSVGTLNSAAQRLGRGDLSQRVPAKGRDEIGELGRTFNAMADGLESSERQRRSMVADVAHELRTPLSNIQGYVEAVRDGVLPPDAATIDTIHRQGLSLAHLVEDLRVLAETESPDFHLDRQVHSVNEVVAASVEAFRPRAEAAGVALEVQADPGDPRAELDRTRVGQVVGNLVDNAIRHTQAGGRVTVSVRADGPAVEVTVADDGQGIPQEDLPYLFERFYRVDQSRDRRTGGAGLGLTIAKHLVEAHGGEIRAESEPGMGSRLSFRLPREGSALTS